MQSLDWIISWTAWNRFS